MLMTFLSYACKTKLTVCVLISRRGRQHCLVICCQGQGHSTHQGRACALSCCGCHVVVELAPRRLGIRCDARLCEQGLDLDLMQ